MKYLALFLIFLVSPIYAVTITEKDNIDTREFTVIFTKDEFDFFLLDKGDPKEWIRNACEASKNRQETFIKKELVEKLTLPTKENIQTKVSEKKLERNKSIQDTGIGVVYE